ncbi:hypothetical protein [Streptomyces uncialis]
MTEAEDLSQDEHRALKADAGGTTVPVTGLALAPLVLSCAAIG